MSLNFTSTNVGKSTYKLQVYFYVILYKLFSITISHHNMAYKSRYMSMIAERSAFVAYSPHKTREITSFLGIQVKSNGNIN